MNRIGRSASRSPEQKSKKKVSFGRGDQHALRLYEHAKTQQQYKEQLKDWYDAQKEQDEIYPFNPMLNSKSLRMASSDSKSIV